MFQPLNGKNAAFSQFGELCPTGGLTVTSFEKTGFDRAVDHGGNTFFRIAARGVARLVNHCFRIDRGNIRRQVRLIGHVAAAYFNTLQQRSHFKPCRKALGFQPVSSTKSYDAYAAAQHSKQVRVDKLDDLTALALKTFDTGDPAGRKEMLKDLKDWNSRMKEEGKPNMLIAPKEVIRRVKARRRENRPTPKNLREKARMQEAWN